MIIWSITFYYRSHGKCWVNLTLVDWIFFTRNGFMITDMTFYLIFKCCVFCFVFHITIGLNTSWIWQFSSVCSVPTTFLSVPGKILWPGKAASPLKNSKSRANQRLASPSLIKMEAFGIGPCLNWEVKSTSLITSWILKGETI